MSRASGWVAVLLAASAVEVASAAAPPGRYTVSADTVKDNRTGLVWQRIVDEGLYTQSAAATYCQNLALPGSWRLPTKEELESLVDDTQRPAIDLNAFPNTLSQADDGQRPIYWTSSPLVGQSGVAWYIDFALGESSYTSTTTKYRVRCVR